MGHSKSSANRKGQSIKTCIKKLKFVIKTACYWHKNRQVDQCNQIEDTDVNLHSYELPISDKKANIQQKKESSLNKILLFEL